MMILSNANITRQPTQRQCSGPYRLIRPAVPERSTRSMQKQHREIANGLQSVNNDLRDCDAELLVESMISCNQPSEWAPKIFHKTSYCGKLTGC
jgi:hypothetical protein